MEAMVFIWSKLSDKTVVQQFSFLWTSRACNKRQIKYLLCKNVENCLKGKTIKQLKNSPCKEKTSQASKYFPSHRTLQP